MDHTKLYQADLDSLRQELFVCDLRFVLCVALLVCRNQNLFHGPLGVQPEERAWFRSGCHDDLYPVLSVILPRKAPICQSYTKVPPYNLCFLKHKCFSVGYVLAVFFTFAKLVFNLVISDIHQHMS